MRYFEKELSKNLKTLFFLLNPVPFNGQRYQKQKGYGTSAQSLSRSRKSSEKFLCYILSDKIWWCNVKQFLSYSKNYICKFMQVNSWHHKLFHFHLSFWIRKVWKDNFKTTGQFLFSKAKLRFCAGWNPAHVKCLRWWESLIIVPTGDIV